MMMDLYLEGNHTPDMFFIIREKHKNTYNQSSAKARLKPTAELTSRNIEKRRNEVRTKTGKIIS